MSCFFSIGFAEYNVYTIHHVSCSRDCWAILSSWRLSCPEHDPKYRHRLLTIELRCGIRHPRVCRMQVGPDSLNLSDRSRQTRRSVACPATKARAIPAQESRRAVQKSLGVPNPVDGPNSASKAQGSVVGPTAWGFED